MEAAQHLPSLQTKEYSTPCKGFYVIRISLTPFRYKNASMDNPRTPNEFPARDDVTPLNALTVPRVARVQCFLKSPRAYHVLSSPSCLSAPRAASCSSTLSDLIEDDLHLLRPHAINDVPSAYLFHHVIRVRLANDRYLARKPLLERLGHKIAVCGEPPCEGRLNL